MPLNKLQPPLSGPRFLSRHALKPAELPGHVLRLTEFGLVDDEPLVHDFLHSNVHVIPLDEQSYELWTVPGKVTYKQWADIELSRSQHLSLVRIRVNEHARSARSSLAQASFEGYSRLLETVDKFELGNLLRIWNYVPRLLDPAEGHLPSRDLERYRQFNIGRTEAWGDYFTDSSGKTVYPAATVIGTYDGPLVIEALVTHDPIVFVDNPRQVAPYRYPKQYGTTAPNFSRGALHQTAGGFEFYISGTASIVGSETTHKDDPSAQTNETIENIAHLIGKDNLAAYDHPGFELKDLTSIRVYIKHPEHYREIRSVVEKRLSGTPAIYINEDICRPDLLLEIEGIARKKS